MYALVGEVAARSRQPSKSAPRAARRIIPWRLNRARRSWLSKRARERRTEPTGWGGLLDVSHHAQGLVFTASVDNSSELRPLNLRRSGSKGSLRLMLSKRSDRTLACLFLLTLSAIGAVACTGTATDADPNSTQPIRSQCSPTAESIQSTIFAASCDGAGCHGVASPAVGLTLVGTSPERLIGASSALCAGWAMVVPGSPEKSFLYEKLVSSTPACGASMPLGGHVSDADAACIRGWIAGLGGGNGCETCGGTECVTLASDPANCGQCGNACPDGIACENGSCSCAAGTQACSGVCVDTAADVNNCGACGNACPAGSTCSGGVCSCPAPLSSCGSTCADVQADGANCGGCGKACSSGQVCLLGNCSDGCGDLEECGSSCVDLQTSVLNCGACDRACPGGTACVAGKCECSGGGELCGTACVDTKADAANCGGCGVACGAGEGCVDGACQCVVSATVSFKADVEPILDGACTAAGCHTGARPKESLALDTGTAYAELVNVATSQCGGKRKLVVPGSPSSSYLMQKLLKIDVCTGTQMPKAGQFLPAADLDVISSWICSGAPDN